MTKRIGLFCLWIVLVGCFLAASAHAQTAPATPPDLLEGAQSFAVTGNFAASSGNATNNGASASMEFRFSTHVYGRVDQFGLSNPSGTMLSFAELQGKWAFSHLIKPNQYFDTNPILISAHAGPGILKSPSGAVAFAGAIGVSVDYVLPGMSGKMFLRPIDVTVAYSRGLANNFAVLGTWTAVQTGLGLRF